MRPCAPSWRRAGCAEHELGGRRSSYNLSGNVTSGLPIERAIFPTEQVLSHIEKTIVPRERAILPLEKTIAPREKAGAPREKAIVPIERAIVLAEEPRKLHFQTGCSGCYHM